MAQHTGLYRLATYYDIAMHRDIRDQMTFITDVYHHHLHRPLNSLLDIACGPGYHAIAAAQQGMRAVGLDLMPEMIAYAREQADTSVDVTWLAADMRDFDLPEQVDMAICMFDGIDALLDNDDMIRHFRSVARNLTDDGLYLVHHTHPRDCSYGNYGRYRYSGERDGVRVEIEWATNQPVFDPITGVAEVDIALHIHEGETTQVIHDRARERLYTPQELTLLAQLSGSLAVLAWYGAFDVRQPLDASPRSETLLLVLQKSGERDNGQRS